MVKELQYVLWGSAGHAKVLASMISFSGGKVVALFDNNPHSSSSLPDVPLFIGTEGFARWALNTKHLNKVRGLAAIGGFRGRDRVKIQQIFREHNLIIEPLVHPTASICPTAQLGPGTQVLAQSVVAAEAKIGEACIINHRASVDHECFLDDGIHLAPGATLCGCVWLGKNVMIGANAVVLPRIKIGENAIVGSGSVVTKELPPNAIAYGNPAKVHRYREIDE